MKTVHLTLAEFAYQKYWPTVGPGLQVDWQHTTSHYILPRIIAQLGSLLLTDLSGEAVERWWNRLRSECQSATTANKYLARFKHLCSKAVQWGYLDINPARFLRKAPEPQGRVQRFTPGQWQDLLTQANPALRLYMLFAHYTAARRSSLVALRRGDIDLEKNVILFRHTKNGDNHVVPIVTHLRDILLAMNLPADPSAPILPRIHPASLSQAFRRLCRRCGLLDYRFHDIRHDVASLLTVNGMPQRGVMYFLGHKDPRSTVRYTHLTLPELRDKLEGAL